MSESDKHQPAAKQESSTAESADTRNSNLPSPESRAAKKGKAANKLSIAAIAAHLLASNCPDSRELAEAVAVASRIVDEAARTPQLMAYQIFPREGQLSIREIAEVFKEHEWKKVNSPGTVTTLVRDLLDAMHRDIQEQRALVAAAFRNKRLAIEPEQAEFAAIARFKSVIQELGMDLAIGTKLNDLANRFWHDLVEAWLQGENEIGKNLAKLSGASPSVFSAICPNSSYEEYLEARRPPRDLGADGLLAVILWLNHRLRGALAEGENRESANNILSELNLWPGFLFPIDRHTSQPFAEYLGSLNVEPVDELALLKKFDLGVQRFSNVLGRVMLAEFSTKIPNNKRSEFLQELRNKWNNLEADEKANLSEMIFGEPTQTFECVSSFLRGEMPYFPTRLPFHGAGTPFPIRPYAQNLEMLLHSVREAGRLACHLGMADGLQDIDDLVKEEHVRIVEASGELSDSQHKATQEKIARGEKLAQEVASKFNPGTVNAHMLFRYAAERGLQPVRLVRR